MHHGKVYCAGPLFNPAERKEMEAIDSAMAGAGFDTFLPHRDGLEVRHFNTPSAECSGDGELLDRAVFALDVYRVVEWSDVVVANLNGRVPDEGTIVEATLGWSSGKVVVLYKNDERLLTRNGDNPMCRGLGRFRIVGNIDDIPSAAHDLLKEVAMDDVTEVVGKGRRIAQRLRELRCSGGQCEIEIMRSVIGSVQI